MIFRRFSESDTLCFYDYLQALSDKTLRFFTPNELDFKAAKRLTTKEAVNDTDMINYGAFTNGEMAGYCFFKYFEKEIPIIAIGVCDKYQNRGIGRNLLQFALNEAKAANKKGVRLTTFKDNFRAQHLYRSVGFIDTGDKNAPEGEIELFYMFNNNPVPSYWDKGIGTY